MVTIIGAGLSGLATAWRLQQAGVDVTLLEAGASVGGRIQPASLEGASHQDLGPSWVWPDAQPVISAWLDELGIATFPQYDSGDALMDEHPQHSAAPQFIPGQHGIARVNGGTSAIVRALLPAVADTVQLNRVVTGCEYIDGEFLLSVNENRADGTIKPLQLNASQLIVATPPRLAVSILQSKDRREDTALQVELKDVLQVLNQTSTWMALHAKVVIFYDTAFWRERGLSGRVASRVGPLVEIHDHCGPHGTPAALFGFAGVPAQYRADRPAFITSIEQQLNRCFGSDTPQPDKIVVKDWAYEKFITTDADLAGPGSHPSVISELARRGWCDNQLFFAASETSAVSPGLIEGALARADQVARQIVDLKL